MTDFLAMGGYGVYIWPAYGAAILILGGLTGSTIQRYRRAQRMLSLLQAERNRT